VRRLRPALEGELAQAGQPLLEVDDAPAVLERPRGVAVGDTSCDLIRSEETEPDQKLAREIRVTTRQEAPSGCNGGGHDLLILNVADVAQLPHCGVIRRSATSTSTLARSRDR
jgi:hypothetical protein